MISPSVGWSADSTPVTLIQSGDLGIKNPQTQETFAEDLQGIDYGRDVEDPGDFPYTRGIHKSGYRGKRWTMLGRRSSSRDASRIRRCCLNALVFFWSKTETTISSLNGNGPSNPSLGHLLTNPYVGRLWLESRPGLPAWIRPSCCQADD